MPEPQHYLGFLAAIALKQMWQFQGCKSLSAKYLIGIILSRSPAIRTFSSPLLLTVNLKCHGIFPWQITEHVKYALRIHGLVCIHNGSSSTLYSRPHYLEAFVYLTMMARAIGNIKFFWIVVKDTLQLQKGPYHFPRSSFTTCHTQK